VDGMTWDNYGDWHIDHIIPISTAKTLDDVMALNNYKNLQPLWWIDNLIKGSKYDLETKD
jgi:5-methylcytosine-specific restriction endonuclease McrA